MAYEDDWALSTSYFRSRSPFCPPLVPFLVLPKMATHQLSLYVAFMTGNLTTFPYSKDFPCGKRNGRGGGRDFASINYLSQTPSTGYDILPATTAIIGYAIDLVGADDDDELMLNVLRCHETY